MSEDRDLHVGTPVPCACEKCGWTVTRGFVACDCDAGGNFPLPCVCGPDVAWGVCGQCGTPMLSVAELEQIAEWQRQCRAEEGR